MNVQSAIVEENREDAMQHYREYRTALKTHKEKHIQELAAVYWQLSRGRQVLDVYKAIMDAGLNADNDPKFAITYADQTQAFFAHRDRGGYFYTRTTTGREHIVMNFPRDSWQVRTQNWERRSAPVPIIPPAHLPPSGLSNFHILWEVEKWTPEPPTDPILLKHITGTLYAVMAQWDLTPAEQAVMRGAFRMN
jgi:hypothetical protein